MRWNETCTLTATTYAPDSEGVQQPTEVHRDVFCNPRTVGMSTWSSMYEIGVSADAQIEIRTCDYDGQLDCYYRGKWYSVEVAQEHGDFTILTMRHQQADMGDDAAPAGQADGGEGDGE